MPLLLSERAPDTRSVPDGVATQEQPASHSVLAAGPEFFGDLLSELDAAEQYVFINMFLWRNDASGRAVANKLLEAAERGVQVRIAKDRMGAFFEYGEANGQSFFHDESHNESTWGTHSLKSVQWQAKAMAIFYGNQPEDQKPNPLARELQEHPNVHILDRTKTYDHSKVIVVDGRTAYIGGVGFGDEFCGDQEDVWLDFMLKITSATDVENLLHTLVGNNVKHDSTLAFGTDAFDASLYEDLLRFIRKTQESLTVVMPFLGSVPYISALGDIARSGRNVRIITSAEASSNRYRNPHFLKTLVRECRDALSHLTIILTEKVTHGKLLIRDDTVRLGSQNMVLGGPRTKHVVDETVVETSDPALVDAFRYSLGTQLNNTNTTNHSEEFDGFHATYPWSRIIVGSRLEWLAAIVQHQMATARMEKIRDARNQVKDMIRGLL